MSECIDAINGRICRLCHGGNMKNIADIHKKPAQETDFAIAPDCYRRQIVKCETCGVYMNFHRMLPEDFYQNGYNRATYRQDLASSFHRIMALPLPQSDNKQRVRRIHKFCSERNKTPDCTKVLDVGSGLGVFLAELQSYGYHCVCLDPDPIAVEHARKYGGVHAGYVGTLDDFSYGSGFDLITFNKVLEHVTAPTAMLSVALQWLNPDGLIYIELPDGDMALRFGTAIDREEFYIEHLTVFNKKSLHYLAAASGLACLASASIYEPSDKYTIYAWLASQCLATGRL